MNEGYKSKGNDFELEITGTSKQLRSNWRGKLYLCRGIFSRYSSLIANNRPFSKMAAENSNTLE